MSDTNNSGSCNWEWLFDCCEIVGLNYAVMRNIIKSKLVSTEAARKYEMARTLLIGPVSVVRQCICIHPRLSLTGR